MARAAGIHLTIEDFDAISAITPLLAKVYPNGLADVNHFHAAGGLSFMIGELLDAGLLHEDVITIMGKGLSHYRQEPKLSGEDIEFRPVSGNSENKKILRPVKTPFQPSGGLKKLDGNLGSAMIKISALAQERHIIEAPARIFETQLPVKEAIKNNSITSDTILVVRFQGPQANGMPELHGLTPVLAVLQDRGLRVALVTDGRMSGASGKVPSAIHLSPEAAVGGPISKLRDGDMIRLDARSGALMVLEPDFKNRPVQTADLTGNHHGTGRELFDMFRNNVGLAAAGAGIVV